DVVLAGRGARRATGRRAAGGGRKRTRLRGGLGAEEFGAPLLQLLCSTPHGALVGAVVDAEQGGRVLEVVTSRTQAEVEALAAKEKAQGQRAGARTALEEFATEHGFSNVDDAKAFITAARKAQQDALSEDEKRRQQLEQRERELTAREAAATVRERDAHRRTVLVGLGATGDDLEDAAALLRVDDSADESTVRGAAEKLKERRPELFGTKAAPQPSALPPAPGGAPAGGPPRAPASKDDVQARARKRAEQMGFRRPDAA
ncbi:hypothetical protein, partial [Streptomyces sp. sk2.1]|uniref:hypothetical protein n=1 Tax=Streptomyces sp. sk2.1 TaxID=2478959 RepID=UPI00141D2EE1